MRYYKRMSKADKPIKPAYIRQFVALIDKVKELQA
jgi:hypothetical protein